jgi:hypothetical protein
MVGAICGWSVRIGQNSFYTLRKVNKLFIIGVLCLVMCLQFVLYLKSKKVEVLAVEVQKEEAKGSEKEVKNDEENKNESQERIL